MLHTFEYSQKELALLKYFSLDEISKYISPDQIYKLAALSAFVRNEENNVFTVSLRNILKNSNLQTPFYRFTTEYEALIDDKVLDTK